MPTTLGRTMGLFVPAADQPSARPSPSSASPAGSTGSARRRQYRVSTTTSRSSRRSRCTDRVRRRHGSRAAHWRRRAVPAFISARSATPASQPSSRARPCFGRVGVAAVSAHRDQAPPPTRAAMHGLAPRPQHSESTQRGCFVALRELNAHDRRALPSAIDDVVRR